MNLKFIKSGLLISVAVVTMILTGHTVVEAAPHMPEQTKTIERHALIYTDYKLQVMDQEATDEYFLERETPEQEEIRLVKEEQKRLAKLKARRAARKAARKAAIKERRQAVVDYATQFLGNPYVYGGTSLTYGTDCSGYVMGVYAHFGVSLPHSSYGQRSVGYGVSYDEMQPGDIVCYSGHVGIYAGNGQIINAIDEGRGIGYSNVGYSTILAIRRIF